MGGWIALLLLMPPAWARALFLLPFMHSFARNVNTAMALVDLVLVVLVVDDVRRERPRAAYPVALLLISAAAVGSIFAHGWPGGWRWRG